MEQTWPPTSEEIDIGKLIDVICEYRKESYRFERYVALRTFSSWLHAPTRPHVVNHARLVAAARVIVEINTPALSISVEQRPTVIDAIARKEFSPQV
jgi:hypothetical protein